MGDEHEPGRTESRFRASLPAVIHAGGEDHPCAAQDLSRAGALLVGKFPVPTDPIVRVTLRSSAGDLELSVNARIRRAEEDAAAHLTRLAVEFRGVAQVDRPILESLVSRVIEGAAPASLEMLPPGATAEQIRAALRGVSLPHRIALAARGQAREREILLHDSAPQVLDAMARNPNLLPNDVRALLRIRPLLPSTLETLCREGKWSRDPELKRLLASHPNASPALAERLASTMSPQELQKLVRMPGLNPELRLRLGRRLERPGRG